MMACRQHGTHYRIGHMKKFIIASAIMLPLCAMALDLGPFTLTGFAKVEASQASNQCKTCQRFPDEARHRPWADELNQGVPYGTAGTTLSLFQPYLALKDIHIGGGFKVKGLLSQRWRDGKQDIAGVMYEQNATLHHEDYGQLQIGAFPTRGWSTADYPYGTNIGVADAWASSGSGYGLLTQAVRYGTRLFDVNSGDLYLEATYDMGSKDAKVQKPEFYELYAKYVKGPLMLDMTAQSAKNGQALAWGHAPFIGAATTAPYQGNIVPGNKQSMVMAMARYNYNSKTDLYAGLRRNQWSGAKAVITGQNANGSYLWNDMFNIDNAAATGQGYSASSTDMSFGVVHRFKPQWSIRAGGVYLGKAKTSNPVDRGQNNSMLLGTVGLGYEVKPGFSVYGFTGMVRYAQKGQAPLSMPSHASFTGVDSRVATTGNWLGAGLVYTF